MKQAKFYLFILLVGLLVILFPISVLADVAPPDVPNGENINPGEGTTMVQMVAEEVIIDVGLSQETVFTDINDFSLGGYIVAYNCTFWLENRGSETESLAVRFPINNDYEYGKINILSIKVNGLPISWIEDEVGDRMTLEPFNWAYFNVMFPPSEEVEINVTYTSVSYGWLGSFHHSVSYVLETGAGWYGPIEEGRIILRFPYQATQENIIEVDFSPAEGVYNDSDLYWEFSDLEPTRFDNLRVRIVVPDLWLDILSERGRLEGSPNNSSALYRLAEKISYATIDRGIVYSSSLYEEGLDAIRRAIELNPGNVENHELYTRYLLAYDSMEYYLLALEEIDIILELDPSNESAGYSREWALSYLERYQTATARALATSTSTFTPLPTSTPIISTPTLTGEPGQDTPPTQTSTQLNTPDIEEENLTSDSDQPMKLALIISIAILLLLSGFGFIWASNRKKE